MQIRELLTDDDAVSPVIGVILMVAITVILAAVIAAFVLGLGDTSDVGPQVSFDYDYNESSQDLTIKVSSGDSFTASQVEFRGANIGSGNSGSAWYEAASNSPSSTGADSTVGAGDRATISNVQSNFQLEMTWTSEDGDDSSILSTRTGPDA